MNSIPKNVRMRDVANAAGVSTAAVSKALNNKPDISPELRKKIFTICEEMDYQVNSSIQDLVRKGRKGKTNHIAFITVKSAFADPVYSRSLDGISRGMQKHGLYLVLDRMTGNEKSVYDLPPILRDGRVDGIVVTGEINVNVISVLRKLEIPYVILGSYNKKITESSINVKIDTEMSMELIVRELKKQGKNKIAFFTENPDGYYEKETLDLFKLIITNNELSLFDELIFKGSGYFSGAIKALEKIFTQPKLPFDSIICPDFRAAQDISHLILAYYGIGKTPQVTIGTLRAYSYYTLPVPAVYAEISFDRVAAEGLDVLVDIINGKKENSPKQIILKPLNSNI